MFGAGPGSELVPDPECVNPDVLPVLMVLSPCVFSYSLYIIRIAIGDLGFPTYRPARPAAPTPPVPMTSSGGPTFAPTLSSCLRCSL